MKKNQFHPGLPTFALLTCLLLLLLFSCKNKVNQTQELFPAAFTVDSAFDEETGQKTADLFGKNKYYYMRLTKGALDSLLADSSFGGIYFALANDNAIKPRNSFLVGYATNNSGDYLMKDTANNPIAIPLVAVKNPVPKILKDKEATLGNFMMSKAAIQARLAMIGGTSYAFVQMIPHMGSPISYKFSLIDEGGNMVGSDCSLQPSPPAQPGEGECL